MFVVVSPVVAQPRCSVRKPPQNAFLKPWSKRAKKRSQMLATLASAAAAPPLAPPGAADAPTLDLYVGDERRTTITTTFGTATEALAAAVLRAGDPGDAVEGRVVLAARIGGEAFEFVDPPSTALRPGDALGLTR